MRRTLAAIFQEPDPANTIKYLKFKPFKIEEWAKLALVYEPKSHAILDDKVFKGKAIRNDKGVIQRYEDVTRIAVGLQKLIIRRLSEFMFTLPVDLTCEEAADNTIMAEQFKSFKKILDGVKWNTLNKERCRIISSQCEVATYWYTVEKPNKKYGFPSKKKLKCQIFSPENGDSLYPLFDDTGDLIAFSRGYSVFDEDNKETHKFDCWTAENFYRWGQSGIANKWVLEETKPNPLKKIPISYAYRKAPLWDDFDNGKVFEVEKLLSNNGDIIAYHAAPVLLLKGKLDGAPTKSESNKVFVTDADGGAEYVSWTQSPESVKFQFETLLRMIFTESQMPDLSFENMRGMGDISGEALKRMLIDPHLKVGDESSIYLDMIERDQSVIKAYMALLNTAWAGSVEDMELENKINPFMIEDMLADVEVALKANGNKPLISHEQSVLDAARTKDPAADWKKIQAEAEAEAQRDVLMPGGGVDLDEEVIEE